MSTFEQLKIVNEAGVVINPAADETIQLLKRIAKLLEPSGTQDGNQRQRMICDFAYLYGPYGAAGNTPTPGPPLLTTSQGYLLTWAGPVDPRFTNLEQARTSYALGIRSKLI